MEQSLTAHDGFQSDDEPRPNRVQSRPPEVAEMAVDDLLVCSVCHGELDQENDGRTLGCTQCGRAYPRNEGVADMTPIPPPDDVLRSKWSLWEDLQANGAASYDHDPKSSLAVGMRADVARFVEFCDLRGSVLDVGCGPQRRPTYAVSDRFVGVDPLRGTQPRDFDFVQGIAEYLPFARDTFDHVLFVTSLDHLLDPVRALREAARVLAPGGTIEIFSGDVPETGDVAKPRTIAESAKHAARLLRDRDFAEFAVGLRIRLGLRSASTDASAYTVPPGAADAFHFFRPTRSAVEAIISASGLTIIEAVDPEPGQRFLRAVPR